MNCRYTLSIINLRKLPNFWAHFLIKKKKKINLSSVFFLIFLKNKFIYLFLAALSLRCCARAFSRWRRAGGGYFSLAVHGLLIAVASLVAEHEL